VSLFADVPQNTPLYRAFESVTGIASHVIGLLEKPVLFVKGSLPNTDVRKILSKGSFASSHGGAGLGLWICRRIVAAHGGEIDVESTLGEGTRVRVWLPQARNVNAASVPQNAIS
jgi:nitrogen-specific signal transduction histidine kinase